MDAATETVAPVALVSPGASTRALAAFHHAAWPSTTLAHDDQLEPLKRGWKAAVASLADEARWAAEKAASRHQRSFLDTSDAEPAPSNAHRVLLDVAEKLARDLEAVGNADAFPNYAELPVSLPAGHWRQLLAIVTALGQAVPDVAAILPKDEQHA